MTEASESGVQQAAAPKSWANKVVVSLVAAALIATAGTLFAHESRVTVLETQRVSETKAHTALHDATTKTLDEIRADVKKLLEGDK